MTTKNQAWNDEITAQLVEQYAETTDLKVISKALGKSVPEVRGKLVSLKVYVKPEARAVGGASPVRKVALVQQLAKALNVEFDEIESLEKAKKETLELLIESLASLTSE